MTTDPKAAVLAQFPDATAVKCHIDAWRIDDGKYPPYTATVGFGCSETYAWADAAKRLETP